MKSITYGDVDLDRIVQIIDDLVSTHPNDNYQIIVGTDSQNFDKTKIVVVIAVIRESKGGIFFYDITKVDRINNIKQKLMAETGISVDYATRLMEAFDKHYEETGFDYTNLHFSIHVDAGFNGPTKDVIPEIVGWIKACGWDVHVKPESYVASSIADKISK